VHLVVAVEEGQPGGVGRQVRFHHLIAVDHRDVLDDAARRPARDGDDLEALALEMDGMDVIRAVAQAEPIARRGAA
jgi:hypothetical protein